MMGMGVLVCKLGAGKYAGNEQIRTRQKISDFFVFLFLFYFFSRLFFFSFFFSSIVKRSDFNQSLVACNIFRSCLLRPTFIYYPGEIVFFLRDIFQTKKKRKKTRKIKKTQKISKYRKKRKKRF